MAKKNRSTLKRYFREGALPSEDQFGDLIDSSLNTVDEGFDRTVENGFEISLVGSSERLLSFFQQPNVQRNPVWSVRYDKQHNSLVFYKPDQEEAFPATLTLGAKGRVGINTPEPQNTLDVNGVVAAKGRIGINPTEQTSVPADGKWHDISGPLTGCHAFEVMAGVGSKGTGRYALLNAIAMNTFNPTGWIFNFLNFKKRIRRIQAYYLSRSSRIKLRWAKKKDDKTDEDSYCLQIATNTAYGDGIHIRYHITQLWFDESMSGSQQVVAPAASTGQDNNG